MARRNRGVRVPSHARLVLICFAIAANALCAGGVYSFPLISPALVTHMKLTQPQLTTIALAGMVGQYPFAAFVGKLLDRYGPRACSLLSAVFFSMGFGFFSLEIAHTPDTIEKPSSASFRRLTVCFCLAGLATVLSYFSFVFSATKAFPHYMGVASGTSMAIFGFSPLLLSALATRYFTVPETGLNVTRFLAFLAILSGVVHFISALCMQGSDHATRAPDVTSIEDPEPSSSSAGTVPTIVENIGDSETRPLLVNKKPSSDLDIPIFSVPEPLHGSVADLLKDPYFWILTLVVATVLGTAETVMANLGSIFVSLPAKSGADISTQVQLLSASNTLSRLIVGPLADFVSPVASYLHSGIWSFPRKQHVSRIAFLTGAASVSALTFLWLVLTVRTQAGMWFLSVGVGIVYGTTFTILPGILSSIWGLPNLGRNFGIISYAPFFGTTFFSYIYAFVADHHTSPSETACKGVECWQTTFWFSTMITLVAACGSGVLWRRWKGRV
ncbi:putative monocarboxylate transporter mch1 [Steccherinum ochraceum]|uniref:Putative monocarboxylate transporter mch1 n=1 Tax=Steccherinum ochraceum TaxID=92696 RepID=A0A4R0R6I5_9APHY|nr:putative monocarboxylate transporter mch1 [Steccherinum ochraceum]